MKTTIITACLLFMLLGAALGAPHKGLPFINDNFEKALAEAKQRNLPLFVEVWAPW